MSTNIQESLHELIKYLSKSEKRYFKVYATRHSAGNENNYILLFDYLDQQQNYDEEALFKHFKGQAFLNKFSISKKRLYDQILAALTAFHANASVEAQLHKLLQSADILYEKSLYEQSKRILRSAEKLALKHELYHLLSEISDKQKRMYENSGHVDLEEVKRIFENDMDYQLKSKQYAQLWKLKSNLFGLLASRGVSRSSEDLLEFNVLFQELSEIDPSQLRNFESNYLYNHIQSAYYFAIANSEQSLTYLKRNIDLLESDRGHVEQHPKRYFSILTNAIFIASKVNQNQEAQSYLYKLKSLKDTYNIQESEDFNIKLFSSINSLELTLLVLKGEVNEAMQKIPLIESGMILYAEKLTSNRKAFLNFKIATVYFVSGDFHASLKAINQIINDAELDQQEDILSFAHLMSLLIHLEMKNENLLPYAIKSTQRYLKSRNRLYGFERVFMKYLHLFSKAKDVFDQHTLLEEMLAELNQIKDDSFESLAFDYFDFQAWAEAKVKRLSLQDLIRSKYQLKRVS